METDLLSPCSQRMFERFTAKAIKAIMLAQEEARRLGHNFVGTEQILLGLIGEGTGVAAIMLGNRGVTLANARIEVERIIGRGRGFVAVEIPFTPRAKKLLELAWGSARQLGSDCICTEHLLMGLIAGGEDGVGMRVLKNLRADLPDMLGQIEYLRLETAASFRKSFWTRLVERFLGERKTPVLSESARKTMELAEVGAREAGHCCLGSDQILLAILHDENNVAATSLHEGGATLERVKTQILETVGYGPGDRGADLKNTPRTDRIIALALAEAQQSKDAEAGIEHLLLGLLKENSGAGRKVLSALGVDRALVLNALFRLMSRQ
jgi:ATP-dependent Clp protease ATP-binding subunit ClpA